MWIKYAHVGVRGFICVDRFYMEIFFVKWVLGSVLGNFVERLIGHWPVFIKWSIHFHITLQITTFSEAICQNEIVMIFFVWFKLNWVEVLETEISLATWHIVIVVFFWNNPPVDICQPSENRVSSTHTSLRGKFQLKRKKSCWASLLKCKICNLI